MVADGNQSATGATSVRDGDMVGNGDIDSVTPLSKAVLTLHLAWCLFRIMEIVKNGDIVENGDIVGNDDIAGNGDINFLTLLSQWPIFKFPFGNEVLGTK